jgi:hypothetical protein
LADEYIYGSNGSIAVILGLDIEYGIRSKKASLSISRPWVVTDLDKKEAAVLEIFSNYEASAYDWNGKLHISNSTVDAEKLLASLQKRIFVDQDAQACTEALAGLSAYYKVDCPFSKDLALC